MKGAPLQRKEKTAKKISVQTAGSNFERMDEETKRALDYMLALRIAALEIGQSRDISPESSSKVATLLELMVRYEHPLQMFFSSAATRKARTAIDHITITRYFLRQREKSKGDKTKRHKRDLVEVQDQIEVSEATVKAATRAYLRYAKQLPYASSHIFFSGMRAALNAAAQTKRQNNKKRSSR